jgi:hypothetical protein
MTFWKILGFIGEVILVTAAIAVIYLDLVIILCL